MSGFRIATIRGIPIRIHFTFLIVLPLIAYSFGRAFVEATRYADVPPQLLVGNPWLWGFGVALALFVSVLIHELAHAFYARHTGGHVEDITLLMIGGASRISEMPKRPRHEAIMALVGPLTSLVLGGVFYGLQLLTSPTAFNLRFAFFYLASLNLFLGVFNLLPAFPMDGGRILRSVLVSRMGLLRATRTASQVGKVFAVLFAVWGFVSFNMLLLLVAFFVYLGADAENRAVMVKALLGQVRIQDVMKDHVVPLASNTTVHEAAERMLHERRLFYVVTVEGPSLGLLTLEAIASVPAELRRQTLARDVAVRLPPVAPSEDVERALQIMNDTNASQVAVSDAGRLVGTVSREDIVRVLKLTELEATQHQPH
jgi:Zn-dependent protease/CBS domain-containing protein